MDEIYELGASGYWIWRHDGACMARFSCIGDEERLGRIHVRHETICHLHSDGEWFQLPPDWRAYAIDRNY